MHKILFISLLLLFVSGCASVTKREYYESGQLKAETYREGFIEWSDGDNKEINLPLANPQINAMGIGK
jgi:hypothetical protein